MTGFLETALLVAVAMMALLLALFLIGSLVARWWWTGYERLNGESWLEDSTEPWRDDVRRRV